MDVRSYLASTRFAVIVTAVVVAIPVNYLIFDLTGNQSLAFLGMFTLAVSVPQAYSQSWPAEYDRPRGAAWAVGACAVTLAVFLAAYVVATLAVGGLGAAIAAFLAVQLALSTISYSLEPDESTADGLDAGNDPDDAT